jgi:hypothetical protein
MAALNWRLLRKEWTIVLLKAASYPEIFSRPAWSPSKGLREGKDPICSVLRKQMLIILQKRGGKMSCSCLPKNSSPLKVIDFFLPLSHNRYSPRLHCCL